MITEVMNLKNKDQLFDVYIGRGSKWGNPFIIGRDGTREEVIEKYRSYILSNPVLMASLPELDGKILACYCVPLSWACACGVD